MHFSLLAEPDPRIQRGEIPRNARASPLFRIWRERRTRSSLVLRSFWTRAVLHLRDPGTDLREVKNTERRCGEQRPVVSSRRKIKVVAIVQIDEALTALFGSELQVATEIN